MGWQRPRGPPFPASVSEPREVQQFSSGRHHTRRLYARSLTRRPPSGRDGGARQPDGEVGDHHVADDRRVEDPTRYALAQTADPPAAGRRPATPDSGGRRRARSATTGRGTPECAPACSPPGDRPPASNPAARPSAAGRARTSSRLSLRPCCPASSRSAAKSDRPCRPSRAPSFHHRPAPPRRQTSSIRSRE